MRAVRKRFMSKKNVLRANPLLRLLWALRNTVNFGGHLLEGVRGPIGQLSEAHMMRIAQRKTGLSDFWGDNFRPCFHELTNAYREEGSPDFLGRLLVQWRLISYLKNRLLIANGLNRHPEILEVNIHKPLFITSLPRTGTTFLHKLLAQDENARPLLAWEARWPAHCSKNVDQPSETRINRIRRIAKLLYFLAPRAKTIHKIDPDGPEECILFLANTFFLLGPRIPVRYRRWILQQSTEVWQAAYIEYHRQLQIIQFNRPCDGYWLLKSPIHIFGIDSILKQFPDSHVVLIHRDPSASIASLCSLANTVSLLEGDRKHRDSLGLPVLEWVAAGLRRAEKARTRANADRFIDIWYEDLVTNPLGTVRRLYEQVGYTYTAEFEKRAEQWIQENPKNKYGIHEYNLEAYGLTSQRIDECISWYRERYQV